MTVLMCNRGRGRGTVRGYFSFSFPFSLFTICLFTTRLHVRNRNHDDDERPAPLAPHANTRSRAPLTGDNGSKEHKKKAGLSFRFFILFLVRFLSSFLVPFSFTTDCNFWVKCHSHLFSVV